VQGILFGYAALLTADEFHPYRICAGDIIPPLCRCAPAFLSRERRSWTMAHLRSVVRPHEEGARCTNVRPCAWSDPLCQLVV